VLTIARINYEANKHVIVICEEGNTRVQYSWCLAPRICRVIYCFSAIVFSARKSQAMDLDHTLELKFACTEHRSFNADRRQWNVYAQARQKCQRHGQASRERDIYNLKMTFGGRAMHACNKKRAVKSYSRDQCTSCVLS
jgi:hypothetical protein